MRRLHLRQLLLLAAMVAETCAAESNAPVAAPPAREDAINATKRDFDLIKASREGVAPPGATLPRVTVPDFSAGPGPGAGSSAKPGLPDQKSVNWLVDAMEKRPDPHKAPGKGDDIPSRTEEGRELVPKPEKERELRGREAETTKAEPGLREVVVFNPLTRFMADWMTPQDLALMKPVMEARAGGEFSGTTRTGGAVSVAEFVLPVAGEGVPSAIGSERTFLRQPPRENPYLQAMSPPAPAALPVLAPAPGLPLQGEPRPLAPVPAPPAPKSSIPDFAKPLNDEKYFKQLKRF